MRSNRSKESVCVNRILERFAAAKKDGAASVTIHSNALGDGGIVGCELFPKTTTAEAILAIMSIF